MDRIQPPIVPIVGDLIRRTPGTISLGQGVVHYGPPSAVGTAVRAALERNSTHEYHDGNGLPALIDRIRRKLAIENATIVDDRSRVLVTAGANMAFMHAVLVTTNPGDEIILPSPFYFNHEMAIEMAGCRVVAVKTDAAYQLDVDAIRNAVTSRTRAIVTVSPNNPTGAVYSTESLRAVNALCAERGLYHLSDEPYEYFTYGSATHVSPASFPGAAPHTISMFSLSKAYGFAGWRIGYVVYPEHLAEAMLKSQDTILICPTIAAQEAAIAALDVGRSYCEPYVRELDSIRRMVSARLAELGDRVEAPSADGAFYCFLRVHDAGDPLEIASRLIREHKVAVIPGTAFGADGCSFRVAYGALQKETVAEGIGRLVDGIRSRFR